MAAPQRLILIVAAACLTAMMAGIVLGHYAFPPPPAQAPDASLTGSLVLPAPQAEPSQAVTNVRAAIPALEAWNADHGTYTGATLAKLRQQYDYGLENVRVVFATRNDYCLESRVGNAVASKRGPAGDILPQSCS
jgi:hypothetical protein